MIKGRFYVWLVSTIGFVGGLIALALAVAADKDHAALVALISTLIAQSVTWLLALEAV